MLLLPLQLAGVVGVGRQSDTEAQVSHFSECNRLFVFATPQGASPDSTVVNLGTPTQLRVGNKIERGHSQKSL